MLTSIKAADMQRPLLWVTLGAVISAAVTAALFSSLTQHERLLNPWRTNRQAGWRMRMQSQGRRPLVKEVIPWQPVLTEEEVQQAQGYYGSGRRMRQVAAKLLEGKPIKVYTLGGSVTRGLGASAPNATYPSRLFQIINATFPHKGHVFSNQGIGGTSSGIFAACAEQLVAKDADLVVVEFTYNEPSDKEYDSPQRRGYEQLLRKLLQLPGQPAVIMAHYYSWWFTYGDSLTRGLYYIPAEAQLSVFANYYDMPIISMRAAVWRLMAARINGFKPDKVLGKNISSPLGIPIPTVPEGQEERYYYADRMHPSDRGHKTIAEALAGPLLRALAEVSSQQTDLSSSSSSSSSSSRREQRLEGLPPPMIPNNAESPTSLCAMQEDFKPVVKLWQGFEYRPEKPNATSFVEQKWGWSGQSPGDWAEMEVDTRADATGKTSSGSSSIWLSYLKSYKDMGKAKVECLFGCACEPSTIDGMWWRRESLQQIHSFKVSEHPQCRIRVTIMPSNEAVNKVVLQGIMVSQYPIRLTVYSHQVEDVVANKVSSSDSSSGGGSKGSRR